jgi:starch-binding outer membrane protein, SusD/RagB family
MKYSSLYKGVLLTSIMTVAFVISCTRDLDKTDPSRPTLDSYFKNSAELLKGTNAIYSVVHSASLVAREWYFLHDLRSDDVKPGGGQLEIPRRQVWIGAVTPANAVMNNVWNGLYMVIHRSNTVIANGPNVTDNDALRDRLVAEAKFFRAWAYFELVSMWGPVPIYVEPVNSPNDFQSRAPEDDVYALIKQDLQDAAGVLPASYTGNDLGRVTSGAANAVLGRALMQSGDYQGARDALKAVENSGEYALMNNYMENFYEETEFNSESVFEIAFFDRGDNAFSWGYTSDGSGEPQSTVRNQEYCPVAWRNLIPSSRLINEFEMTATGAAKTDPRQAMTIYKTGDTYNNGQTVLTDANQNGDTATFNGVRMKVSWRKYMLLYKQTFDQAQFNPGGNNQRIIRYAEVLLMLAECENELNNPGAAVDYLNMIRDRPGILMPNYPTAQYPTGNKAEIMRAIMHEKTVELGGEEIRNRDILRWRKKGYFAIEPFSYFVANRDELLPIPQQEIDNNPLLGEGEVPAQNQGY